MIYCTTKVTYSWPITTVDPEQQISQQKNIDNTTYIDLFREMKYSIPEADRTFPTCKQTWLLCTGWRTGGLELLCTDPHSSPSTAPDSQHNIYIYNTELSNATTKIKHLHPKTKQNNQAQSMPIYHHHQTEQFFN